MSNLIGQSLGKYHILEQLGEGGMATVYKAYDTRLERNVAVKVILPYRQHSEKFLKRFEREAKSLAQLSHPNIVGVIDYGEQDGVPYLVMEYLPGGTLKEKLGSPLDPSAAARILAPIAYALELAHRHNIIHRDIKPANILLTETGQPMLSDFGIAKMLESEETAELTGTGVGIGTPDYMAPEQGMGKQVDGRADIYSLGITFYELVTGRKPYRADTPMAVLHKQMSEPLPRPSKFVPGIPDYVENVLIKALAKDAANRYQNMGEFAQALDSIAAQKSAAPKIAISKRKIMPALIGLLVVALIGAGVYLASSGAFKTSDLAAAAPSQTESAASAPTKPQPAATLERPTYPPGTGLGDGLIVQSCGDGVCIFNSSGISIREFKIAELAGGIIREPSWSSDGTKIIFGRATSEDPEHSSELYMLDVETETLTQLTRTPDNEITPVWSPDGKRIAFHKNCDLWMMAPDGSSLEKHFARGDQCVSQPRWSPDSQWLAWVSPGRRDGGDVQFISIYNPNEKKIFSIPLKFDMNSGHNDAWSPDGSALYVFVETQGDRKIYKLDAACLKTECSEANVAMVDFDIPQSWLPSYYPQWDKNPQTSESIAPVYIEGKTLFEENFENDNVLNLDALMHPGTGDPKDYWSIQQGQDGNHYLVGAPPTTVESWFYIGSESWKNYALQLRANVQNAETSGHGGRGFEVTFRNIRGQCGKGFVLGVGESSYLLQNIQKNKCEGIHLSNPDVSEVVFDQWLTIRIEAYGPEMRIYLGDQLIYNFTNDAALNGSVSIGTGTGVAVFFDDIRIVELVPR